MSAIAATRAKTGVFHVGRRNPREASGRFSIRRSQSRTNAPTPQYSASRPSSADIESPRTTIRSHEVHPTANAISSPTTAVVLEEDAVGGVHAHSRCSPQIPPRGRDRWRCPTSPALFRAPFSNQKSAQWRMHVVPELKRSKHSSSVRSISTDKVGISEAIVISH